MGKMLSASYRLSGPGIYYATETYIGCQLQDFYTIYILTICIIHCCLHITLYATEKYMPLVYQKTSTYMIYSMLQRHAHNKTAVRFLHGIFYVRQAYTQEVNQKASAFNNTYPHSGWINCHLVSCGKCYRTCVCGVSVRTNSVPRDSATQQTIFLQLAPQFCFVL